MKHEDIKAVYSKEEYIGEKIIVCGWIKTIRKSKTMTFIEINDGTTLKNLQLVIDNQDKINLEFLEKFSVGSSVAVEGIVVNSMNQNQKIELNVINAKLLGYCPKDYPIQKKKQNMEYLREIPHLRVRTNTFNAFFRVRSVLAKAVHDYFQENNFTYVNTPILTGSTCEGAGEMFKVTTLDIDKVSKEEYKPNIYGDDFFGKKVGLTVSGQLEAEAMACALGKVYTFGPSFRAENSNTKRHAAEFWLIEPEIAFADLNDTIEIIDDMCKYIVKTLLKECPEEMKFFTKFYDNELLNRLMNILENDFGRLEYTDAIKILEESGIQFEYPVYWGCDLKSEHLNFLINIVFKRPLYIINYPREVKPFYVKLNSDGKTVASADLFFSGLGDVIGACQKEDNFELLENRIKDLNMTEEDYYWYLDLRKYGTVPHSGFGLGLERLLMYVTGMSNIRDVSAFPRTKCRMLKL